MRNHEGARPVRWRLLLWPLGLLALLLGAGLAWAWLSEAPQRQSRVLLSLMMGVPAAAMTLIWVLVWLLALSGLRPRVRLVSFAAVLALLLAVSQSVEVRGFTGDTRPILGWRWSRGAGGLPTPGGSPAIAAASMGGAGADYPQFLGPRRDAGLPGVRLSRDWSRPPERLWRRPIGAGWSAFAVAGDYAVTQEQRAGDELVTCYDTLTGELRWSHADPVRFDEAISGPGPRATPTIDDGQVFALGGTGVLNALDLATGRLLWSRDVVAENQAPIPDYGVCASPLVLGSRVLVAVGGRGGRALVAYDRATGRPEWAAGDDPPGYGSPALLELAGVPQVVVLNGRHVSAHDPDSGRLLWNYPWPPETQNVSQPVALDGERLFVSSGYGVGGKLLAIEAGDEAGSLAPRLVWESMGLKAKFTVVVRHDGFLYGLDDGILTCLDPSDGSRRWKRGRYGHGQILLAGDLLLILAEDGRVALVEADPAAYRELGSFRALEGKTWNHPALAGDRLLVRNDREAACYRLPLER